MELQIPYCICTKVSAENILPREAERNRRNIAQALRMETGGNHRGRGMPRSYPHVGKYSAKDQRIRIRRVFEGKEYAHHL